MPRRGCRRRSPGLLVAPGVLLGPLLVPVARVRHGSIHLRVGLAWALLRALVLLVLLGLGEWLLQLLRLLLEVVVVPAAIVVVEPVVGVLVGLSPAASSAAAAAPGAAPTTAS